MALNLGDSGEPGAGLEWDGRQARADEECSDTGMNKQAPWMSEFGGQGTL